MRIMLGQRIASLRRQADMSQAELAKRLRISPSSVGMYEQDRRTPSPELLAAMAELFGVTTDFLITGRPGNDAESRTLSALLLDRVAGTDARLNQRTDRPFSRQELAVLFAAMLMEP